MYLFDLCYCGTRSLYFSNAILCSKCLKSVQYLSIHTPYIKKYLYHTYLYSKGISKNCLIPLKSFTAQT